MIVFVTEQLVGSYRSVPKRQKQTNRQTQNPLETECGRKEK